MHSKTSTRLLLAALAILTLTMAGCANLFGSDDDDNDGDSAIAEVGDELSGGWEVTFVDGNGQGYFAEQEFSADNTWTGEAETRVLVVGTFHDDIEFTNDKIWYLDGAVFIGNNAQNPDDAIGNTLTIAAGTEIRGDVSSSNPGVLIITRGSDISAVGTATDPITLTSSNAPGERDAGDWGGLILNGYGRVQGEYAEGEGGTGEYGGGASPVDDDSSGTIQYVRVQFAGTLFSPDNELNGIVFQGVGSGTTVEYIQVHKNADDGIEFFGGSVQVKYYVGTGNQDDTLDGDDGWNGSAQHVILQHYPGDAGSLIEADGDADDVFPAANAILANVTAISSVATDSGFRFKSDANYAVYNSVLDMSAVDANASITDAVSTVEFEGTLITDGTIPGSSATNGDKLTAFTGGDGNEFRDGSDSGIQTAILTTGDEPTTDGADWPTVFAVAPAAGSFAAQTLPSADPAGNSLDATTHVGAYDGSDQWWDGWIATPVN